jgi:hypothetical protein
MTWQRMTIDELAAFEKAVGGKVVNVDGVWWRETRPCFFRPLDFMAELPPKNAHYPGKAICGGVQHRVPSDSPSNSTLHFFIYDDLHNYSLDRFNHSRKWKIKKGIKNFTIKPINDPEEFIRAGHPLYQSFFQRTHYFYRKDRLSPSSFAKWARVLYAFPKIKILGAYHQGKMCAVSLSHLINKTITYAIFFSETDALRLNVSDAMLHFLRERASGCPEAVTIYLGMRTEYKGIDDFKVNRGCNVVSVPAYYKVNPVALSCLKFFRKNNYDRLLGVGWNNHS